MKCTVWRVESGVVAALRAVWIAGRRGDIMWLCSDKPPVPLRFISIRCACKRHTQVLYLSYKVEPSVIRKLQQKG